MDQALAMVVYHVVADQRLGHGHLRSDLRSRRAR